MDDHHPGQRSTLACDGGVSDEERTWAIVAHLAGFAGFVVPVIGNILGPLAVYLIKKEEGPFVEEHAREAVNFQISWTIYSIVAGILTIVLIGFLLLLILGIAWLVLVVIAAIRASDRETYEYPFTIDIV
jgi:hypothetical protein